MTKNRKNRIYRLPRMPRAVIFLILAVALIQNGAVLVAADSQTSNTVTVADFELQGAPSGAGDWAFGLADVLSVELQQRGVVLFERQQIRVVLGERRITASGLMQLRSTPAQQIPDLSYLVTGGIQPLSNQQFRVEASLVESRTGRNVASFSRVPQGIEALLRCEPPPSTNSLACLRKYIDLPAEEAEALAAVQSGLGRWQWDAQTHKFVLGKADRSGK